MKIYLAIPYSFNPERSFEIANKVTALLMQANNIVFSPISHTHFVANYLPERLRKDSGYWMKYDLAFVDWCDELHVVKIGDDGMDLITGSMGVQSEIAHAETVNKPIKIIEYYD